MTGLIKVVALLALTAFSLVNALSVHDLKTLVIYDSKVTNLEDYSQFFKSLTDRTFDVHFSAVDHGNQSLNLFKDNRRLYDNLVVFPIKSRHLLKELPPASLMDFSSAGGDILTITSPEAVPESTRLFLNQLGIYPSPKDYDLVNYSSSGPMRVLKLSDEMVLNKYVSSPQGHSLEYEGSSALLDNNELIVEILTAPRTSACKDSKKNAEDWSVGTQGHLVTGFQTKDNARVTWVGSQNFFDDSHFESNGHFVEELTKWTFREKSVIKSSGAVHKHVDGSNYDKAPYKVKDDVVYEIGLSIWDGQEWQPFVTDDVQFELRLVDPYYRITLAPTDKDNSSQFYSTGEFTLPDHHGIFTFLTDYRRSGLSFICERDVKAIRHLANDEYPRSYEITNAWIYLTSIFSVILAFLVFIILFSAQSKNSTIASEKKKN